MRKTTALTALYPGFGACVPTGTQLKVDRGGVRAMLAESLYRWSVVQRDGPTSPWAAPRRRCCGAVNRIPLRRIIFALNRTRQRFCGVGGR